MNVQVGCDWTLSKVTMLLLVVDFEFVNRSNQSLFRAGCFDLDNSDDREVGEVFFRVDEGYLVDLSHSCPAPSSFTKYLESSRGITSIKNQSS